jgi:DNA-binding CsgD family transcriptional regulator
VNEKLPDSSPVGLPNKAIGIALEISAWTVATHLRLIDRSS